MIPGFEGDCLNLFCYCVYCLLILNNYILITNF